MPVVLLIARLSLATVFAVAGIAKLTDLRGSKLAVVGFGIPSGLADPLGTLLPVAELAAAAALVPVVFTWPAALLALLLLIGFIAGISVNLSRGQRPDCHCFGQLHSEPIGAPTLTRNVVLALLALLVLAAFPRYPQLDPLSAALHLSVGGQFAFGLALFGAMVLAGQIGAVEMLARKNQILSKRAADLENTRAFLKENGLRSGPVDENAMGLRRGDVAPNVSFLDMSGQSRNLADYRGRDILLVFWDSTLQWCRDLVPYIKALEARPPGHESIPLIVVSGRSAGNQIIKLRSPVLVDSDDEAVRAFGIEERPAAVAIDAYGVIASRIARTADEVTVLIADSSQRERALVRWAGLYFDVGRGIATPQLETESLAEKALDITRRLRTPVVADIGTGCGVLAIYLAHYLGDAARVYATDCSESALAIAERNIARHGLSGRIQLLHGNLLTPLPEKPELIVANLTHPDDRVSATHALLQIDARSESSRTPRITGEYKALVAQLAERDWTVPLVLQTDPGSSDSIRRLLQNSLPDGTTQVVPSFDGVHRIVIWLPHTDDTALVGDLGTSA